MTLNIGVWVKERSYNEYKSDYYGLLNVILELEYFEVNKKLTLFKCE